MAGHWKVCPWIQGQWANIFTCWTREALALSFGGEKCTWDLELDFRYGHLRDTIRRRAIIEKEHWRLNLIEGQFVQDWIIPKPRTHMVTSKENLRRRQNYLQGEPGTGKPCKWGQGRRRCSSEAGARLNLKWCWANRACRFLSEIDARKEKWNYKGKSH